jgi:hypothetical protein
MVSGSVIVGRGRRMHVQQRQNARTRIARWLAGELALRADALSQAPHATEHPYRSRPRPHTTRLSPCLRHTDPPLRRPASSPVQAPARVRPSDLRFANPTPFQLSFTYTCRPPRRDAAPQLLERGPNGRKTRRRFAGASSRS